MRALVSGVFGDVRRRGPSRWFLLALLACAWATDAQGQRTVGIADPEVVLSTAAGDPGYVYWPLRVVGDTLVLTYDPLDRTIVVARTGAARVVRRIGRRGEGPGEFNAVDDAIIRGDSLIVLDGNLRRASVFRVADGALLGTWGFPALSGGEHGELHPAMALSAGCWVAYTSRTTPRGSRVEEGVVRVTTYFLVGRGPAGWRTTRLWQYSTERDYVTLPERPLSPAASVRATFPAVRAAAWADAIDVFEPDPTDSTLVRRRYTDCGSAAPTTTRISLQARPMSDAEARELYADMLARGKTEPRRVPGWVEAMLQADARAGRRTYPLFGQVLDGPGGEIWIEQVGSFLFATYPRPREWLRVSADGRRREVVTLPANFRLAALSTRFAYGFVNLDDAPHVARLPIAALVGQPRARRQ